MNKFLLNAYRSQFKTEAAILKRIDFCTTRANKKYLDRKTHEYIFYSEDLPYLYAVLGEMRVKNRRKNNAKIAYNRAQRKKNGITKVRERVSLYEKNLKLFIEDRWLYVTCTAASYKYYRFFFPIDRMSPKGTIHPIEGFTEDVALIFIDAFVKAEERYKKNFYKQFCKNRWSGKEFIKQYNKGVDSYQRIFPEIPRELLYKLYNIRQAGSTAIGNGEYLMRLKIKDITKEKNGDLCTKSGMNLEMKASGGRLSCQVQSNVNAMGDWMLGDGMVKEYKEGKKCGWSDQKIIEHFAISKIATYNDFLTKEQKDLFVKNMVENYDGFFINGEFTEESINRINGCHDAYVYPLLEKFTHLKVDTRQPSSIKNAKDFDVHFKIFNKDDFGTPGLILRMIEQGYIKFYGFIKNNGRDKAVHVGI